MTDKPLEAGVGNCLSNGGVVEFLSGAQFVTPRDPGGVEVCDMLDVVANGGDDVAFHDLHVVDVIEQLEVRVIEKFTKGRPPTGVVALIVGMIDPGVEQLHDENDVVFFRQGKKALQAHGAVFEAFLLRNAVSVSGEGDHVGRFGFRRGGDELAVDLDQGVVVFPAVEGAFDAAQSALVFRRGGDGAAQAEGRNGGNLFRRKEIDSTKSDLDGLVTKLLQREGFKAPSTDGLAEGHGGEGTLDCRIGQSIVVSS